MAPLIVFSMRWILRVALAVVLIAVVIAGFCIYVGVSTSLHAERGLHATLLTFGLLEDYVARHAGRWPDSWADLEHLAPREGGGFNWPEDSQEVQKFVEVDFAEDHQQLAKQDAEQFNAVRPIGPHYEPFVETWRIESLLDVIRANIDQSGNTSY